MNAATEGRRSQNAQVASLLGLAMAAGKVVFVGGEIESAIMRRRTSLLFLAADAAESAAKKFRPLAENNKVQIAEILTRAEIGHAIGKPPRSVAAIADKGFKRAILQALGVVMPEPEKKAKKKEKKPKAKAAAAKRPPQKKRPPKGQNGRRAARAKTGVD